MFISSAIADFVNVLKRQGGGGYEETGCKVKGSEEELIDFLARREALRSVKPRMRFVRGLMRASTSLPISTVASWELGLPSEK